MAKEQKLIQVDIESLIHIKGSPRKMNARVLGMLCGSIKEHGYLELVVIDDKRRIISGDKRIKAMRKLGTTGLIDVIELSGYSDIEMKAVALALNKISGEFDKDKLTEWLLELKQEDYNLYLAGFDDITLEEMEIQMETDSDNENSIEVEQLQGDDTTASAIQPGDLIEMGDHRLFCGDALETADVGRLMNYEKAALLFTDPPYNINYAKTALELRPDSAKDWTGSFCPDGEDNMSAVDYLSFLVTALRNAKEYLLEFAHYYVWFATPYYGTITQAFEENGIPYDKIPIIWKKQTMNITWARYKRNYEPCMFGGKGSVTGTAEKARWFGPDNETAVWEIDAESNNSYIHPTQKPVKLAERAIGNSTLPDEIVLDLFAGSGSALIACKNMGRRAYLMEKSAIYCHRIIERWCSLTGIQDIKINGNPVNWSLYRENIKA